MQKRAQEIFDLEIKNIITTKDIETRKQSFARLAELAGVLDLMGAEADADIIDAFIKEASSLWDFLLGAGGGALTTKDEGGEYFGKSILDALKSGDYSKLFDKKTLVNVITHAIVTGGISVLTGEIINALT